MSTPSSRGLGTFCPLPRQGRWRAEGSFPARWPGLVTRALIPVRRVSGCSAHSETGIRARFHHAGGCVRTAGLSHSFIAFPFSSVISPPRIDLHHPLMTWKILMSWVPTGRRALGPYKCHLLQSSQERWGVGGDVPVFCEQMETQRGGGHRSKDTQLLSSY